METLQLQVRSDRTEYKVPINGEIRYRCFECLDTGFVTVDQGYCGGCEVCGSREEHEVRCPYCNAPDEEDNNRE